MSAKRFTAVKTILDANILVSSVFGFLNNGETSRGTNRYLRPTSIKIFGFGNPLCYKMGFVKEKEWQAPKMKPSNLFKTFPKILLLRISNITYTFVKRLKKA